MLSNSHFINSLRNQNFYGLFCLRPNTKHKGTMLMLFDSKGKKKKKSHIGAPEWLSLLSIRLLILAHGHWIKTHIRFHAKNGACLRFYLSLYLCPSPYSVRKCTNSLSLSKTKQNKQKSIHLKYSFNTFIL